MGLLVCVQDEGTCQTLRLLIIYLLSPFVSERDENITNRYFYD